MSVKVNIDPALQHLTRNQPRVEVNGVTVGKCLEHLIKQFPSLERWLLDAQGNLRDSVDVFVNRVSSFPEELGKPVKDGDELHIITIISGG